MNTGDLLLRAVLCDPGDDTARLAYADWLEEQSETLTATCPGCGGSLEADAFMHVGPIGKPTQIIPIGKQPCRTCEDEYGDPSGLVRVKNAAHGRAAFIRGMIDLEKCRPDCGVGRVCRGTTVLPPKVTCAGVRDRVTELFDSNLCRWESGVVIPNCAYRLPWRGTGDTAPVMAIFRRGFVDEVRLPAAAFTEGFARELFSRHPVTKVVLTDREPWQNYYGTAFSWSCDDDPGGGSPQSCRVPESWLDILDDDPDAEFKSLTWVGFTTPESASAAMLRTAVAWGRSLAGLPPLPAQTPVDG